MVDLRVESRVMGMVDHASSAYEPFSFTGESRERERKEIESADGKKG